MVKEKERKEEEAAVGKRQPQEAEGRRRREGRKDGRKEGRKGLNPNPKPLNPKQRDGGSGTGERRTSKRRERGGRRVCVWGGWGGSVLNCQVGEVFVLVQAQSSLPLFPSLPFFSVFIYHTHPSFLLEQVWYAPLNTFLSPPLPFRQRGREGGEREREGERDRERERERGRKGFWKERERDDGKERERERERERK